MRVSFPSSFASLFYKIRQAALSSKCGCCSAPSNIALVKYWGKEAQAFQIPLNSSLSFTLGGFRSLTNIHPKEGKNHTFFLNGKPSTLPARIHHVLDLLLPELGYTQSLSIESSCNFPHSCGLASSASGGAALIGALFDAFFLADIFTAEEQRRWLTEGARLLSGSATRSVLPAAFVLWERLANQLETRTIAVPSTLSSLAHGVVLLDATPKSLSSSKGHDNAPTSPLFAWRQASLPRILQEVQESLRLGDWQTLSRHAEQEAFALHAITQTAHPPFCYLSTATQTFLQAFLIERDRQQVRVFMTIDAGPNIHLLFLEEEREAVRSLLRRVAESFQAPLPVLFNQTSTPIAIGTDAITALPELLIQKEIFSPS
ncbi:MAG: diphosphomevalonate decarboxylase [Holosporales bacterium]|jgi:diphosphomevalonate decarboxylase|nr:diphosphomevalonate decarboxylase [Holosporales bacterium]